MVHQFSQMKRANRPAFPYFITISQTTQTQTPHLKGLPLRMQITKALDKACPTESDVYTCQLTSGCVSWRHHRFAAEANCERRLADAVQASWHPLQSRPAQHATKWLPWRQRCTSDNNNNEKRNLQRQHSLEPHSLESLAPVCYVKLWPRYTPHTWVMWHELGSVMWLYDVYVQMM